MSPTAESPGRAVQPRVGPATISAISHVAIAALPFLASLLVWVLATPRVQLVFIDAERGVLLPDAATARASQILVFVVLISASAIASTAVLWRLRPELRSPSGLLVLVGGPTVLGACSAVVAPLLGRVWVPAPGAASAGDLVSLPPSLGPLYFGPVFPGIQGGSWTQFPDAAGWALLCLAMAGITAGTVAYLDPRSDLGAFPERARSELRDVASGLEGEAPRTGR